MPILVSSASFEVSPGVPGVVTCELRAKAGQEFATQAFQRGAIVHVVPGGQQFDFQADFPGTLQRLIEYPLRTPVDLLKEPWMQALDTDQVVAAVIGAAQHHSISRTR